MDSAQQTFGGGGGIMLGLLAPSPLFRAPANRLCAAMVQAAAGDLTGFMTLSVFLSYPAQTLSRRECSRDPRFLEPADRRSC